VKTEIIDIDDTEPNEDWIKEVTCKREQNQGPLIRVVKPGETEEKMLSQKGDEPGHPFRGNQYTDGQGGEDKLQGEKANPVGKDTHDQYRRPDGSFTPERQALHNKIKEKILAGRTPVKDPVAYMMGGGPAAGKSSMLRSGGVKVPENTVLIDSDAIKAELPEYQEMTAAKDTNAATFVHEESSYLSKEILKEASSAKYNIMLDGTGDNGIKSLTAKIEMMRAGGQKVVGMYATCSTDDAVSRSMSRAEKTGRYVPEAFIREIHAAVSRVLPEAIKGGLYDEVQVYDTSGGLNLIASAKGTSLTVHDAAGWKRFTDKGG